jgi:hypothetical protein
MLPAAAGPTCQPAGRRAGHTLTVRRAVALALLAAALIGGRDASAQPPALGGCPLFPADNVWNVRVDTLPRDPRSDAYIASIGSSTGLHPDFGADPAYGIPYVVVPEGQARVPVSFEYADESDPGPYPIPPSAPIEGGGDAGGDRHVLVVEQGSCRLHELFAAYRQADGSWRAGSGAVWDLRSNALRPDGWTSADAAGLPILPGLVRREEVESGAIEHALRFTAVRTRRAHVWPARHDASSNVDPNVPPMGQRFRLKASFDLSGFSRDTRVMLRAMQTYGLILADNGSNWYVSGTSHPAWDNDVLNPELRRVRGSDFEAVDLSSLPVSPDSGQVAGPARAPTATPNPALTRRGYVPWLAR